MSFFSKSISETDKIIFGSIQDELARQQNQIELIASENIVSKAVLEVQGSIFTNKYAEGYPNSRYYSGCDYVDVADELAIASYYVGKKEDSKKINTHLLNRLDLPASDRERITNNLKF